RVLFDTDTDDVPARQVPCEAYRRFRTDLRERKERNRHTRAAQLVVHEDKKRFVANWISAHGSSQQRAREAAGLLAMDEGIEAIADALFVVAKEVPRFERDGASRLQTYLRQFPRYAGIIVNDGDVLVTTTLANSATSKEWAALAHLRRILPEATL